MRLAVYDSVPDYSFAMARYLSRQDPSLETAGFSEKEELASYCSLTMPEILLVSEEDADEEILALPAGLVILLTASDVHPAPGDAGYVRPAGPPVIEKYQSVNEILAQALILLEPDKETGGNPEMSVRTALTVFYAPAGMPAGEAPAWAYARARREERSVLYLNLYENAGFPDRFGRAYRRDLSDLIFMTGHYGSRFKNLLKSVLAEDDGVLYIPPPEDAADLFRMGEDDWNLFLDCLICQSGYDEAVIDLQFLFPMAWRILEMSGKIYLFAEEDSPYPGRLNHFFRLFSRQFGDEAKKKLMEIHGAGDGRGI